MWDDREGLDEKMAAARKSSAQNADEPKPVPLVTLADVAALAGVGESTASRVLRGKGSFSEKSRQRVLGAAHKLGYVPNLIAGSLASSGSHLVAIIVPSLSNIVFADLLTGASEAFSRHGMRTVIGVSEYDPALEENLISSMLAWRPAALLLAGLEHSQHSRGMARASSCRVAEMLDIDGEGIDLVVGFSNVAAGLASARHLIERGYRHIAYVGHNLERDTRAGKRYTGFRSALTQAGLALAGEDRTAGPSSVEAGRLGLERVLATGRKVDAVYFSNDDMAMGGYFHCMSAGISVPGQLALFGYNGLSMVAQAPQPLSTLRTPRVEIGATTARLLMDQAPAQVLDLGFELVPGETS